MIVFLRNWMKEGKPTKGDPQGRHSGTQCCAIRVSHVEFFTGAEARVEIIHPYNGDMTHIEVEGDRFKWGEVYDYCILYEDEQDYIIKNDFPKCKWFN